MARRPALLMLIVATALSSVLLAIAVNVATGGDLPARLASLRNLAWPSVGILALVTVGLAVWQFTLQQPAEGIGLTPANTAGSAIRPARRLAGLLRLAPSPEVQERIRRRQPLAAYLLAALQAADATGTEPWAEEHYTPLDVEAEVEHRGRSRRSRPWRATAGTGPVRQPLRDVLQPLTRPRGEQQILLLEGAPGAGKSVALRHLAIQLCRQAVVGQRGLRDRGRVPLLPVYVNLAQLRPTSTQVTWQAVQQLVLATIGSDDAEVRELLDAEFHPLQHRREWLFLFDSFDEIPELLSAVEADPVIDQYETAIREFLRRMMCSGVIASRTYRGPRRTTVVRLVHLTEASKHELARRLGLTQEDMALLVAGLASADPEVWELSGIPLFLTLLCRHVKREHRFPSGVHETFESWTADRFERERVRLHDRFGLTPETARVVAESVAFCMLREDRLGFTADRRRLARACSRRGLATEAQVDKVLDAVEFIRLGRPSVRADRQPGTDPVPFAFAHRRFQEYLAASFVLREPRRLPRLQLLTDGRWREAAVACCQLQTDRQVAGLLATAEELLDEALGQVPELVNEAELQETGPLELSPDPAPFHWPARVLHVLGLLDAGLANRSGQIIEPLRRRAGRLLLTATRDGTLADRKTALQSAGIAPHEVQVRLLRAAFDDRSAQLRDTAFAEVGRLREVPDDLAEQIRRTVLTLWGRGWRPRGELGRDEFTITAQLARLPKPEPFVAAQAMLLRVLPIDFVAATAAVAFVLTPPAHPSDPLATLVLGGSLLFGPTFRVVFHRSLPRPLVLIPYSALFLRGLLVLVLAIFAATRTWSLVRMWDWHVLASLPLLLGLTWAPAAVAAVVMGSVRSRRDSWVPHLPLARGCLQGSQRLLRTMRRNLWRILRELAFALFLAVLVTGILVGLGRWAEPALVGSAVAIIILLALLGFLAAAVLWAAWALIWGLPEVIRQIRGWQSFRRFRRSPPHSVTVVQLLEQLGLLRSTRQVRGLLRTVRVEELLRRDLQVEELAYVLAAAERAERYEERLRAAQRDGIRGVLDRLRSPTAQPDPFQWLWQVAARVIGARRRTAAGHRRPPPAIPGQAAPGTVIVEVREWLVRMTADRRQPLLYYDHTCRDELVLIMEQVRPTT